MQTVAAIVDYLEGLAPPNLAAEWDNVGLLLGDRTAPVERIMTCLTLTSEPAAEAIAADAQLIVTHHPILFRPVKRLTTATPEGRLLLGLMRAGMAVYSPHTAFDNCAGGINDFLVGRLGLTHIGPLRSMAGPRQCKIVVFVPEADLGRVSEAMFSAGAGHIGQYSQCSFRLLGTGTFFGSEQTNPTLGQKGRREEVLEWRLEVICPEDKVAAVVTALRKAHSYEEPAFDVYPLQPIPAGTGDGRSGHFPRPLPLPEAAHLVASVLRADGVQMVGEADRRVEKVGIACGAGGEFIADAVGCRCDALLTGEVRFHDCLAAQAQGLALILPGHYATERPGVEHLAEKLQQQWPDLLVWASERERDPGRWLPGQLP
jgi:dinuclear metal center YbgI/SA1388 family protein